MAIVIAQVAWIAPSSTLTTHWGFNGTPDSHATAGAVFWDFFPPAAILALTVTALVVAVGGDISRRGGAAGIGLVSWFLSTITGIWFVLRFVALHPAHAATYIAVLVVSGIVFGAIAGGAVALPRRHNGV